MVLKTGLFLEVRMEERELTKYYLIYAILIYILVSFWSPGVVQHTCKYGRHDTSYRPATFRVAAGGQGFME